MTGDHVALSLLNCIAETSFVSEDDRVRVTDLVFVYTAPPLIVTVPDGGVVSRMMVSVIAAVVQFPVLSLTLAYTVLILSPVVRFQLLVAAYGSAVDHVVLSLLNCI